MILDTGKLSPHYTTLRLTPCWGGSGCVPWPAPPQWSPPSSRRYRGSTRPRPWSWAGSRCLSSCRPSSGAPRGRCGGRWRRLACVQSPPGGGTSHSLQGSLSAQLQTTDRELFSTFIVNLLEVRLVQNPLSINDQALQATLEVLYGRSGWNSMRKTSDVVKPRGHRVLSSVECH